MNHLLLLSVVVIGCSALKNKTNDHSVPDFCSYEGKLYQKEESFIPDSCVGICVCRGFGNVTCAPLCSPPANFTCQPGKKEIFVDMIKYTKPLCRCKEKECVKSGLSKCQEDKLVATFSQQEIPGGFIPKCKQDGSYEKIQCHELAKSCWCVKTETGIQINGTWRKIGKGVPQCDCNVNCTESFLPVCGSDGKTYPNKCWLNNAMCTNPILKLAYQESCRPLPPHGILKKIIVECIKMCSREYTPVCGNDYKTYENLCSLRNVKCKHPSLKIASKGKCKPLSVPVNGGYSPWSNYTACSESCGENGVKLRSRCCTNPVPQYGGRNCSLLGKPIDAAICNNFGCPVDGGYTEWGEYSSCSKPCGGGEQSRSRFCTNPVPLHNGRDCSTLGLPTESKSCNKHNCSVNGGYSQWSNYLTCTKPCGSGIKFRSRSCSNPKPENSGWNCSTLGEAVESIVCNNHACPVNGGYSQWADYSTCTEICGSGIKFRARSCTNPKPQHNGRDCSTFGEAVDSAVCNTQPCPGVPLRSMINDEAVKGVKGASAHILSGYCTKLFILGWVMCALHRMI